MDGVIGLSNLPIPITAIVLVVPKSLMLQAKGEDIKEEMWGDIVIDEFVDDNDELHSF